jgi:hypothetical protein
VLKQIPGPRQPSPLVEEFGGHQLRQPRVQGVLVLRGNGRKQLIGKLPPQHRPELRYLFGHLELIQPGHERIL